MLTAKLLCDCPFKCDLAQHVLGLTYTAEVRERQFETAEVRGRQFETCCLDKKNLSALQINVIEDSNLLEY